MTQKLTFLLCGITPVMVIFLSVDVLNNFLQTLGMNPDKASNYSLFLVVLLILILNVLIALLVNIKEPLSARIEIFFASLKYSFISVILFFFSVLIYIFSMGKIEG
jgi:hypothetical protein